MLNNSDHPYMGSLIEFHMFEQFVCPIRDIGFELMKRPQLGEMLCRWIKTWPDE